jgi:hypothetical protein
VNADFIYNFNLTHSQEFLALDALYRVLAKSQEEKWEIWWNYAKNLPARDVLFKQNNLLKFINGFWPTEIFRPAVLFSGYVCGNIPSFLHSYHTGKSDFYDVVK